MWKICKNKTSKYWVYYNKAANPHIKDAWTNKYFPLFPLKVTEDIFLNVIMVDN